MILSAHQPNFLPWGPYFEKASRSDVFVLLGHVQFQKNNYQNRFQHEGRWHTLRVRSGTCEIREKRYIDSVSDWRSIQASLPQFSAVFDSLAPIISDSVWETNTGIIRKILDALEINTKVEVDFPTQLQSTERLLEITDQDLEGRVNEFRELARF